MLFRERIKSGVQKQSKDAKLPFMCDRQTRTCKLKSGIIKSGRGVQINTFGENEWYHVVSLSTVLSKYFNHLAYQQHEYKMYINNVLTTDQFVLHWTGSEL